MLVKVTLVGRCLGEYSKFVLRRKKEQKDKKNQRNGFLSGYTICYSEETDIPSKLPLV